MPEENEIPQEGQEQKMPTFSDLERIAAESLEAGEKAQVPVEDKDEEQKGLEGQAPAVPDKSDFQGKMQKHGFKSEEDLLKSFEEAHAKITRLSQSEAETRRQLDGLAFQYNQAVNALQTKQGQGEVQGNEALFQEVAPLVERMVNQKIQGIAANIEFKENLKMVNAKKSQNPEEFNELVPIMAEIIKRNPHLDRPDQLDTIYEQAREVRNTQASKLLSLALGSDVDMDKVREFFGKKKEGQGSGQQSQEDLKAAFVPASASGGRSVETKQRDWNAEIKKAQEAGDVSKVVDLTYRRAESSKIIGHKIERKG